MSTDEFPEDGVLRRHAQQIGDVTINWNLAQQEVLRLFEFFTGLDPAMADAVFFAVRTDSAQRDMTAAAARAYDVAKKSENDDFPLLGAKAVSLLNRLGKLAGQRNQAIHTMWTLNRDDPAKVRVVPSRKRQGEQTEWEKDASLALLSAGGDIMILAAELHLFRLGLTRAQPEEAPQPKGTP